MNAAPLIQVAPGTLALLTHPTKGMWKSTQKRFFKTIQRGQELRATRQQQGIEAIQTADANTKDFITLEYRKSLLTFTERRDAFREEMGIPWKKQKKGAKASGHPYTEPDGEKKEGNRGGPTLLAATAITVGASGIPHQMSAPLVPTRSASPSASMTSLSSRESKESLDHEAKYEEDVATARQMSFTAIGSSKTLAPLDLATSVIRRRTPT